MRIPLTGGYYVTQGLLANAQRVVNLYPERNPEGDEAPVPVTDYPTPGLIELVQGDLGVWRGLYRASNRQLFGVLNQKVYYITETWSLVELGQLVSARQTPVSMKDNNQDVWIVDGSGLGYTINLGSHAFAQLDDTTGSFQGADKIDYLDTFMVWNFPETQQFNSTLQGGIEFDATYVGSKNAAPDLLKTLICAHNEIWLLGERTTEVWNDAGNPTFPFARVSGAFIPHGCVAKYSVAEADSSPFWLSSDEQGEGIVLKGSPYRATRISTHAIEELIRSWPRRDDALAFVYQIKGHLFYVLTSPSGDMTLVYDNSTELWHQWGSLNASGKLGRHRSNCFAHAYGKLVVGDYSNGKLYELSLTTFSDAGQPIPRIRAFPHMLSDGMRVMHRQFIADVSVGSGASRRDDLGNEINPTIYLRWSDTRGKSWGNPVGQSLGRKGQYLTQPSWNRLGQARDRVYELSWSDNAEVVLNGAFVEGQKGKS